ncbi:Transcription factor Adf-1 [Labeo rohita]|uniref:Transcription factor Adf-1 n=1 Tax=Labeo rohita TaxID=84645 RepID=A0ABQ8L836_LABRO|nr:Transcription factor Adf-1 [Labeo rohita]
MEEKLIVAVSSFPPLYDTSLYSYRDTTVKNEAWRKVAEAVGVPGLRDAFKRDKNREKEASRSGAGSVAYKQWKYSAIMSFLNPFLEFRETFSNMPKVIQPSATNTLLADYPNIQCKEDSPSSKLTPQLQDGQHTPENQSRTECPDSQHQQHLGSQFHLENCPGSPASVSSWPVSPMPSHIAQCSQPSGPPAAGSGTSLQPEESADNQPNASQSFLTEPQRKRVRKEKISCFEERMLSVVEKASIPAPQVQQNYDEDELFLRSILPGLKRLPAQKRSEVKFQMHRLLYEAEMEINRAVN